MMLVHLLIVSFVALSSGVDNTSVWKIQLTHFRTWKGSLNYAQKSTFCTMQGFYVGLDADEPVFMTFSTDDVSFDMIGKSQDNDVVIFEEHGRWEDSQHFENQHDLTFTGRFSNAFSPNYYFEGNVSSAENPAFGTIWLSPAAHQVDIVKEKDELKFGLAIGIPIGLALIISVCAAVIIWWACEKGYLRHVPMTYKSLTNPKKSEIYNLENGKGEVPSVHI